MPDLPSPDWPLRFETRTDGTVGFAEVEQDTDQERQASAAVIACTPRGWRVDDPTFGVTTPLFTSAPVDADRMAAEIAQSDPLLDVTATEAADMLNAAHRAIVLSVASAPPAVED